MASAKKEVMKVEKDDVTHAPESGEPTETSSRARQNGEPHLMHTDPAKPGKPTVGEDRESGQVDKG